MALTMILCGQSIACWSPNALRVCTGTCYVDGLAKCLFVGDRRWVGAGGFWNLEFLKTLLFWTPIFDKELPYFSELR